MTAIYLLRSIRSGICPSTTKLMRYLLLLKVEIFFVFVLPLEDVPRLYSLLFYNTFTVHLRHVPF